MMIWLRTLVATGIAAPAAAQDWPQWRGPERDGAVSGFEAPAEWPETLSEDWSVEVGLGYATPILRGETLWMFVRQDEDEVVLALDPETGETRWRTAYPAPFDMSPATRRHGPGPKSTPALADGRLFVHGMTGSVAAFDAESGEMRWQVPGAGVEPLYHTAMSPLVHEGRVIVHLGGHDDGALTAFDAESGEVHWAWDGDGPAYGSPMLFEFDGVEQVVVFTQEHFVGVGFDDGALLWSRPFTTPSDTTSQTPVRFRDLVIQSGRDNGVVAFRPVRRAGGWATEEAWATDEVSLHMANPVAAGATLFGLSHRNRGQYFALDLETGATLWTSPPRQAGNAAILRAGDWILSLEDDAELAVIEASRDGFREHRRYRVADSDTWTQPVVSGRRVFVKDVSRLHRWTIR